MNHFDQAARYLVKRDPVAFFTWLASGFVGRWHFLGWLDTQTIAFPGDPPRGGKADNIEVWLQLARQEPDVKNRGDLGGLALVLGNLTRHRAVWQKAFKGWNVKQSQQVLEWINEGRTVGRIEGARETLLSILETNFPEGLPPEVSAAVSNLADLKRA